MLKNYRARAAALAALITCATGPVAAESYEVMIMEYGFFPEISYVQEGDQLTFINMSGVTRRIEGRDAVWVTPEMADGAQYVLNIEARMPNTFKSYVEGVEAGAATAADDAAADTDAATTETADDPDGTILGKLNYSAAPLLLSD